MIRTYDIDGVLCMDGWLGIRPASESDVIITGRSIEEEEETRAFLASHGITNKVYFNAVSFDEKSREKSGRHKAKVINELLRLGNTIACHYEDDPEQIQIIKELTPIDVVLVHHQLINKDNVKRDKDGNELS